jgi:hypothetical protein
VIPASLLPEIFVTNWNFKVPSVMNILLSYRTLEAGRSIFSEMIKNFFPSPGTTSLYTVYCTYCTDGIFASLCTVVIYLPLAKCTELEGMYVHVVTEEFFKSCKGS